MVVVNFINIFQATFSYNSVQLTYKSVDGSGQFYQHFSSNFFIQQCYAQSFLYLKHVFCILLAKGNCQIKLLVKI